MALTASQEGGGPYNGVDCRKNSRELIDAELALNEGGWGESDGSRNLKRLAGQRKVRREFSL